MKVRELIGKAFLLICYSAFAVYIVFSIAAS